MYPFKTNLLATTVVPIALVVAGGMTTAAVSNILVSKPAVSACAPCNPCAAKNPCNPCNPCAVKKVGANPCNPCNPCAAVNPCNPCAVANPCNPCNPCAGGAQAGATDCIVPSLARSNANPCNPCAAANPCNPCAAANPCNPCAAANPCNPCAAANPCNPCAAVNPCNPCAAASPCNPCAAANPCNPCAAGTTAKFTDAQAANAYDCVVDQMRSAYRKSGNATAASYLGWRRYSRVAYQSATHGGRYVQNYANPTARAYGAFENSGEMPVGSVLAKDSFTVTGKGRVSVGPLFLMEKMSSGFNAESGNWKYTMIMPNGSTFGETNGRNSSGMQFCIECHAAVAEEQDHMMFMPEKYRSR